MISHGKVGTLDGMARAAGVSMPRFSEEVAALLGDRERLTRFFSVATRLTSAETTDQVLKLVVHAARSLAAADGATLRLFDSGSPGRVVWAGRGGGGGAVALQREIRVAERPYATLRVTTTRSRFTREEKALIDLLCIHAGIAVENVSLRSDEVVLDRIRTLVGTAEHDDLRDATVRQIGDLRIDLARHEVALADAPVHLTPSEFRLLDLLTEEPGRAYTRDEIVARLWNSEYVGNPRIADAHVSRLRRKLERDPRHPERLRHVRGVGYKLVPVSV